ncbi:MAG: ComEA family DNA-binding protein [Bacteroidota bacterium]
MVGGEERGGWRRFWELSRSERYGATVLMVLLSGHLVFRFYDYKYPPKPSVAVVEWTQKEIDFAATVDGMERGDQFGVISPLKPFVFEKTDSAQFVGMGLSPRTAASLQRFRDRGGAVRSLADWYALRVLQDDEKERLAPYLLLPKPTDHRYGANNDQAQHSDQTLGNETARSHNGLKSARLWSVQDLNRSDSAEWDALPGVGPATARRIVEYRERLGGYLHVAQLLEIYGMDSARYESILPFVTLKDRASIRRISLNQCSESELAEHPYAGRTLARRLMAFRERHGSLPPPDSLLKIKLYGVDSGKLSRLLPYLDP